MNIFHLIIVEQAMCPPQRHKKGTLKKSVLHDCFLNFFERTQLKKKI